MRIEHDHAKLYILQTGHIPTGLCPRVESNISIATGDIKIGAIGGMVTTQMRLTHSPGGAKESFARTTYSWARAIATASRPRSAPDRLADFPLRVGRNCGFRQKECVQPNRSDRLWGRADRRTARSIVPPCRARHCSRRRQGEGSRGNPEVVRRAHLRPSEYCRPG